MKLIIGLGNPGEKYAKTRHNLGMWVVDSLAKSESLDFDLFSNHQTEEAKWSEKSALIVKPTTFMNHSGEAVTRAMQYYKVAPEDVLVIRDDIDMEVGKLRLKTESGSGGHKGIDDIVEKIGSNFTQLKIGIGRPETPEEVERYVLEEPTKEEKEKLDQAVEEAVTEVRNWLDH